MNGEGILLIDKDRLTQVRARATGRLVALHVKPGDWVKAGDDIGLIAQDELKDAIDEARSKLEDLRREDREFTQFEEKERETKELAMAQVKQAQLLAQEDSREKLKIARRVVDGANRLRDQKHLGDLELLESREKFYEVRDDLNKGRSRLAELELERRHRGERAEAGPSSSAGSRSSSWRPSWPWTATSWSGPRMSSARRGGRSPRC